MSDFTEAEILAVLRLDATDAARHARCGSKAACRTSALAKCDEDLDAYLALAVPVVRNVGTRAVHGG